MCAGETTASGWSYYSSSGIYRDVDMSSCGFTSTPVVSSSLSGSSSHWTSTGGAELYSITPSGFRTYVASTITASQAGSSTYNWHVNWIAAPATLSRAFCAGATTASGWNYYSSSGIYRDVDISGCGFTTSPVVVTNIAGSSSHWTTNGGAEPYSISTTSFRNYISTTITASQAGSSTYNWHLNWIAAEPVLSPTFCAGKTTASGWTYYSSSGIYRDIDISGCGFTSAPVISSSLSGSSSHWTSTGGAETYSVTATSFRIYISSSITASQAASSTYNWHVHWIAKP